MIISKFSKIFAALTNFKPNLLKMLLNSNSK